MGNCFGFGYEGIRAGSPAACCQSCCYGGDTPGGGWFALGQSKGAKGEGVSKLTICVALFLGLLSIILIVAGVVVGHHPEKFGSIFLYVEDVTGHDFLPKYQLIIAIGVFLCISAICACCCGFFLPISAVFLLVTFIMVIVVIALLSHSAHTFDSGSMESKIKMDLLTKIDSNATADSLLNRIQQKLECCGVENPSDWQLNTFYGNGSVPDSCCKVETPKCGQNYRRQDIFQNGCITDMMKKITVYFRWQNAFLAVFLIIAIFSIFFGCCIVFRR